VSFLGLLNLLDVNYKQNWDNFNDNNKLCLPQCLAYFTSAGAASAINVKDSEQHALCDAYM